MLRRGRLGEEEFEDLTRVLPGVLDRLGDRGRALGEELADLGAAGATEQAVRGGDAWRTLGQDGLVVHAVRAVGGRC